MVDFKGSTILDIGCGTGVFLKPIVEWGCSSLYGIDTKSMYVQQARSNGYKEICYIEDLSYDKIPFENTTFDLVISKDVFEHLMNPKHTLKEIYRVLKSDGLFLIHVPNHFPLTSRIKFLYSNNIDTFKFFDGESRFSYPHIRFYEYADFVKQISELGFKLVLDLSHHFAYFPPLTKTRLTYALARSLAKFSPNNFSAGFSLLFQKLNES
jgi:SAM-dependent methyltransferase